jgi:benzoyl-CoA reductase/2-hydroxyglutaryl-CoA dehydratase subunit BcrC/BadD/HgdB
MKRVGFTTTIPVEIIFAAGKIPVDLNNIFITDSDPAAMADAAEDDGLPRNLCAWIKGIYAAVKRGSVDEVVAVTQGDCSNSHALAELFQNSGIKVHSFSYPFEKDGRHTALKAEMERFAGSIGTSLDEGIRFCRRTDPVRQKLKLLDKMTADGYVTGFENHLWLVTSTDFNTDIDRYEAELDAFTAKAAARTPDKNRLRLGFIGVPTIFSDIYEFIESKGASVVFNEVQRQFAIPSDNPDYVSRYVEYTYPYDVFARVEDISRQIQQRRIDGIVHYVQSFCYRQIQDIIMKQRLDVPVLAIEGDGPAGIDARTKIRLESFLEMLSGRQS